MNAMDFLPVDIIATALGVVGFHNWRIVPTADINTTFALALTVFALMIVFGIKAKGARRLDQGALRARRSASIRSCGRSTSCSTLVEYVSKPLSHSLRLYGNIYAGEIIFLLLGMWAATGLVGTFFGGVLNLGWAIFHILIVLLQAYIFMMLTIVYIAMGEEHH